MLVRHNARFERSEDDLHYSQRLHFPAAALGATVEVPTIDGEKTSIRIPPGTQEGATFRIRGKGMPILEGRGRGDLLVKVRIEVPNHLDARQKQLLEEFAKSLDGSPAANAEPKPSRRPSSSPEEQDAGIFKKLFGS